MITTREYVLVEDQVDLPEGPFFRCYVLEHHAAGLGRSPAMARKLCLLALAEEEGQPAQPDHWDVVEAAKYSAAQAICRHARGKDFGLGDGRVRFICYGCGKAFEGLRLDFHQWFACKDEHNRFHRPYLPVPDDYETADRCFYCVEEERVGVKVPPEREETR